MSDQSHEAGALFEFDLDHRSDVDIWIKHRGTGHIYQFSLSDDRSGLGNDHKIVPNLSSRIDAAMFITPARRAALQYMATPSFASECKHQTGDRGPLPVAEAQTTTEDETAVDLDEQASD
jgi:hypothetical protein